MFQNEIQEKIRVNTKRAIRVEAQAKLRQTLDQQRAEKNKMRQNIREEDRETVKQGVKIELEQNQQRSQFLNKIKQLHTNNNKKIDMLKKFIHSDTIQKAEESDKINFIRYMKKNEQDWKRKENEDREKKIKQAKELHNGLDIQLKEKYEDRQKTRRMDVQFSRMLQDQDK